MQTDWLLRWNSSLDAALCESTQHRPSELWLIVLIGHGRDVLDCFMAEDTQEGYLREMSRVVASHQSSRLSNIVPVEKKNGQIRVCVDFWDQHRACPKDPFPLPNSRRCGGFWPSWTDWILGLQPDVDGWGRQREDTLHYRMGHFHRFG